MLLLHTVAYGGPYASVWSVTTPSRGTKLTAQHWVDAALAAIADGGLAAVAVEPLARTLGATKGSFYWHFRNRDALLDAALQRWERTETDDTIAYVETEPDLVRRLRTLLVVAIGGLPDRPQEGSVELALQATATHPLVAPALARVTRRRLDYLEGLFVALGLDATVARHRAVLAYTAYLGHAQLAHATPGVLPADAGAYADEVVAALTRR